MKPSDTQSSAAVIAFGGRRPQGAPAVKADGEASEQRARILHALHTHRVSDELAHRLARKAAESGQTNATRALETALSTCMSARPINYVEANAVLLMGPSGSGKTTVAAKIATQAHLTGRAVRVICPEPNATRLLELAARLGITLDRWNNWETALKLVAKARIRGDLVVMDTKGFNPRNAKARAAFGAISQIADVETIGVVSALYDASETEELVSALGTERLIVTCLDLTRRAGTLATAATQTTLAHVARSPFPGDGLEPLTPLALAQALLGLGPQTH
jgi:flagellar biosynthesis protein FlhF